MPEQLTAAPRPAAPVDDVPQHLRAAYTAALPGARASVLARLWGALNRENVPGLDHARLSGDPAAARAFAVAQPGLAVEVAGVAHTDPAAALRALRLPGAVDRLATELDNSVHNLALARANRPARPSPRTTDLATVEQLVVDGHPLHPCCRTRLGMTTAEVLAYAPEHLPTVALVEVAVPASRWLSTGAGLPPRLLLHPWQARHTAGAYPWLTPTGRTVPARPLMSLRTLALVDDPTIHVKTAVDVQMTSAVRIVSPAAVHNGPVMSALLARLTAAMPTLDVLPETAAGAVLVDGEPQRGLSYVVRRFPALPPGEVAVPLAALAAPSPADGRPLLRDVVAPHDPARFLADLLDIACPPLFALLDRGVALEAHGQNTLVVLRDGRPVRLLYRDVGGVRVSPARLGAAMPELRGDLVTDDADELRTKLVAAFLTTVVGELIALLAREYDLPTGPLWGRVAAAVRAAGAPAQVWRDPLPMKAMTTMRLAADPLDDVWTHVPNPMAGA
ncbi:IucA/IucC family protein [Luedemannella helvata]|uniref:IucA/IucC family siderophore biosynthesis protein n=1 Tax=Luedemannella helvata TaxID=349315 RepID=A0ABN2KAL5_9ACTN